MKLKTIIIFIIIPVLFFSISGCNSNNLWDNKPGGDDDETIVLADVTMTSIKAGAGQIDLVWIDPVATEFDAIDIICTVTSTSTEFSSSEALPGDQAYTITGVSDGTEYTVTVTVTDSDGNSSAGISMEITPQAAAVEGHFIYTADDMNAVRGGVTGYDDWTLDDAYYLMADINLSGYTSWIPVGDDITPFSGSFDGNSYSVNNMTINSTTYTLNGLFGYITGDIKDLNIADVNIQTNDRSGALAGRSDNNSIENCSMTGSVQGDNSVGGLIGYTDTASVTNSHAEGYVSTASDAAGGLIGENFSGTVDNCYATGNVDGASSSIGGLIGYNSSGIIQNGSYATGNVSGGGSQIGGLVGQSDSGTITDCFYTTGTVTGTGSNIGGLIGISSGDLTGCYVSGNVSINTTQSDFIGGLVGQSSGTITDSYTTDTCNVTVTLSDVSVDPSYVNIGGLVGVASANITNCRTEGSIDVDIAITSTGEVQVHIGGLAGLTNAITIDGSRMTGTILDVNLTGSSSAASDDLYTGGLIGSNSATVTNCYVTCQVNETDDGNVDEISTGGLIGRNSGDISDSYSEGSVTSTGNNVGGLIGYNTGIIDNCHSINTVDGSGTQYGGLIGNNASGNINNSYATGNVTNNGTYNTGGFIGMNVGGTIQNCQATGDVTGNNNSTGGLIGNNGNSSIIDCSASGVVISNGGISTGGLVGYCYSSSSIVRSKATGTTVSGSGSRIGGLVGTNLGGSSITLSYATCDILSGSYIGGLVGYNDNGTISLCYAIGDVEGTSTGAGLIGYINSSTISYCYSIGEVTINAPILNWGGLIGENYDGSSVTNCYYNYENNNGGTNLDGTEVTPFSDMTVESTYAGWDLDPPPATTTWNIDSGINGGYPYLRENPPE